MTLEGESVQLDQDTNTLLYKNPRVVYAGGEITALQLHYKKETGLLSFEGNVVFRARDFLITASTAQFNIKTKRLSAQTVGLYDYVNQTYLNAEKLIQTGENRFEIFETTVTLCKPEDPAWEFYSTFIDYQIDNYAYSINTVLLFYDVPIFYTPVAAWPTRKGRSSGFLTPLFVSKLGDPDQTKNWGNRVQIPYYWAIDSEQDLTFTTDWISKRGVGEQVLYRWAFMPGMSGNFELWHLGETNSRNITLANPLAPLNTDRENLAGLDPDNINPKADRYRYQFNHRQDLGGGQLFLHQDQRSDNEVEKEYQSLRIGQQNSFSQAASWVFPWQGGGFKIGHENSQGFLYPSVFNRATDKPIRLNRDLYIEVGQQMNNLFGSSLSVGAQGISSNYRRDLGWEGNLSTLSTTFQAPFHLDFLNFSPSLNRTFFSYNTQYTSLSTDPDTPNFEPNPDPFGWSIDHTTVEANFEVFRVFGSGTGAKSRLGIRPKVVFEQVQDVDQRQGSNISPTNPTLTDPSSDTGPSIDYARLGNRFIAPTYSFTKLSYRLETRYLTKGSATDNAQSAVSFDLDQSYNLGRKQTLEETWGSYLGPQVPEALQETRLGSQQMPLKITLGLSPAQRYNVGLFYRFDHELGRMVENQVSFSTSSPIGDALQLKYTDNSKAYMGLRGDMHGQTKSYSFLQSITFGLRNRIDFSGLWDINRNDPANLISTGPTVKRLNRQLTKAGALLILGHQCFDYQIGYTEEIMANTTDGVSEEGLDRRVSLSMRLAKWPSLNTPYQHTQSLQ